MEKPISLRIKELKEGLVKAANESQLTCTLMLPYIKELYVQVQEGARMELEKDIREYEQSLKGDSEDEQSAQ